MCSNYFLSKLTVHPTRRLISSVSTSSCLLFNDLSIVLYLFRLRPTIVKLVNRFLLIILNVCLNTILHQFIEIRPFSSTSLWVQFYPHKINLKRPFRNETTVVLNTIVNVLHFKRGFIFYHLSILTLHNLRTCEQWIKIINFNLYF